MDTIGHINYLAGCKDVGRLKRNTSLEINLGSSNSRVNNVFCRAIRGKHWWVRQRMRCGSRDILRSYVAEKSLQESDFAGDLGIIAGSCTQERNNDQGAEQSTDDTIGRDHGARLRVHSRDMQ